MSARRRAWPLALILAGCAHSGLPPAPANIAAGEWRGIATVQDRARLRGWRDTWVEALRQARAADRAAVERQGALFAIDGSLDRPIPPPGSYRCRTFKLGARGGKVGFSVSPDFACRIEPAGAVVRLFKLSGTQRPEGLIYPDTARRGIFLGTLVLGDERDAMQYGRDSHRDMIGLVERIGERRWRVVLPDPAFESRLDVWELVPER